MSLAMHIISKMELVFVEETLLVLEFPLLHGLSLTGRTEHVELFSSLFSTNIDMLRCHL